MTTLVSFGWWGARILLLGGAIAVFFVRLRRSGLRKRRRGRLLLSESETKERERRAPRDETTPGLFWGARLPEEAAENHFFVVGASGAGKTLTMTRLMRGVLPRVGSERFPRHRALVYDPKREFLPLLYAMGIPGKVVTLDPFDRRGASWAISRDVTDHLSAIQVASILVCPPREAGGENGYFYKAARRLLAGVLVWFVERARGEWTLRDVLLVMRSRERMEEVLCEIDGGPELVERYFSVERTLANTLTTIDTELSIYEPVAALWEEAETSFSIAEWIESETVLVLRNNQRARVVVDALNRALIERACSLLLDEKAGDTWLFLDEFRLAGKLDGLLPIPIAGRSFGVHLVLGFQDVDGIYEIYGERAANELLAQCSSKAFLRLESPKTARWASGYFSDVLETRESRSETRSGFFRGSATRSESRVKEELVMPADFLDIPPTTRRNGLTGYYSSSHLGLFRRTLTADEIDRFALPPVETHEPEHLPRSREAQRLRLWSDGDRRGLGLSGSESALSPEGAAELLLVEEPGESEEGLVH